MFNNRIEDTIIFEDKDIIVCHKKSGIAVQNSRIGQLDMESGLKNYIAQKNPGKMPYLGIIHRLDQPVEGVLVFAKNPEAAKKLSAQMTSGKMGKFYLAVVEGEINQSEGTLEDYLKKDGKTNTSAVVNKGVTDAKKAILFYKVLEQIKTEGELNKTLVKIQLDTGRHHQIRVQMSHAGMPLVGDRKYNGNGKINKSLGLCSFCLEFEHPSSKKKMSFQVVPSGDAFEGFKFLEFIKK